MTAADPGATPLSPAWQAYKAQEHQIRAEYLATVQAARQQYDLDVQPARDTYNHVERAAWQTYYAAGRAAWHTYRAALATDPTPPSPPEPVTYPYPAPRDSNGYSGPWTVQPHFTPHQESDQ